MSGLVRTDAAIWQRGLILIRTGSYDNVIRILIPLVAKREDVLQGLDILNGALMDASREAAFRRHKE